MDPWLVGIVVVILVVLLVGIAFAICYSPNYQRSNQNGNKRKHTPNYMLGLRSQVGTDILPSIAIGTTPTDIEFNQPLCESGFLKIPRSGVYQIMYGVDVQFVSNGNASIAIRRRTCDGASGFEILTGSARQAIANGPMVTNVSNSFFAQLNSGDQIKMTAVASSDENVSVPASNSYFLQTPEALASIQVMLKS